MTKYNISIDLSKIEKLKIRNTEKGQKFANFDLIIRDEIDGYGNIGFIFQQQSVSILVLMYVVRRLSASCPRHTCRLSLNPCFNVCSTPTSPKQTIFDNGTDLPF